MAVDRLLDSAPPPVEAMSPLPVRSWWVRTIVQSVFALAALLGLPCWEGLFSESKGSDCAIVTV
jgi:hypothetical protein